MSKHGRLWLLVPVTVALIGLAGCTPTAVTPSATSSGSGSSAAPSAAATPTPSASTASVPVPRAQLKCASLFAIPNVANWMADTHAALKVDETTAPSDIVKIAAKQYGTLSCEWGGKYQTDGAYEDALYVSIATDALDAYEANPLDENGQSHSYTAGTKSAYTCTEESGQFQCTADLLVGTTWASFFLQNEDGSTVTSTLLTSRVKGMLDSLAGQITAAPPALAAWVAPASASPSFCTSTGRTAVVRTIFANPALKQSVYQGGGGAQDAQYGPVSKYVGDCTWENGTHDDQSLEIQSLQGGAWALPVIAAAQPYTDYLGTKFAPVTVTGADSAVLGCGGPSNQCDALIAIKGNAYEVGFEHKDAATDISRLATLVTHLN